MLYLANIVYDFSAEFPSRKYDSSSSEEEEVEVQMPLQTPKDDSWKPSSDDDEDQPKRKEKEKKIGKWTTYERKITKAYFVKNKIKVCNGNMEGLFNKHPHLRERMSEVYQNKLPKHRVTLFTKYIRIWVSN